MPPTPSHTYRTRYQEALDDITLSTRLPDERTHGSGADGARSGGNALGSSREVEWRWLVSVWRHSDATATSS